MGRCARCYEPGSVRGLVLGRPRLEPPVPSVPCCCDGRGSLAAARLQRAPCTRPQCCVLHFGLCAAKPGRGGGGNHGNTVVPARQNALKPALPVKTRPALPPPPPSHFPNPAYRFTSSLHDLQKKPRRDDASIRFSHPAHIYDVRNCRYGIDVGRRASVGNNAASPRAELGN